MKNHKLQKSMLENPDRWPRWPYLPMKRNGDAGYSVTADYPHILLRGFPTMKGILLQLACEDGAPVPGSELSQHADDKARELYEQAIVRRFDDIDQMLDNGWEID